MLGPLRQLGAPSLLLEWDLIFAVEQKMGHGIDDELNNGEPGIDDMGKDTTKQKLSQLTMMGVERMLERGERDEDRRHRWGCWAIVLAFTAGLTVGGYFLYRQAGSLAQLPHEAATLINKWVIYPLQDSMAPDEDRFSIVGLRRVFEGANWQAQGRPEVIVEPTRRQTTQRYRHKGYRVRAIFYDLEERSDVRGLLERVEPPARAVMFDTKAVVIEPVTEADADAAEGLEMLFEAYRAQVLVQAE